MKVFTDVLLFTQFLFAMGFPNFAKAEDSANDQSRLYEAIQKGNVEELKKLLQNGIDPNIIGDMSAEPLWFWAAIEKNPLLLETFLYWGAKVDARNNRGQTGLMWAAAKGLKDNVMLLILHQANVNAQDKDGRSALHYAVDASVTSLYPLDTTSYLIENGADIDLKTANKRTPLMLSIGKPITMTKYLLQKKAGMEHRDDEGSTALMLAGCGNWHEQIKLLLSFGAVNTVKGLEPNTTTIDYCQPDIETRELLEK